MKTTRLMLLLALATVGCSTLHVESDTAPRADFAAVHSFSWTQSDRPGPPGPRASFDNPINLQRVRDSLSTQLAARGIMPAGEGVVPDCLVSYAIGTRDYLWGDPAYGSHWSWGLGWGSGWRRGFNGSLAMSSAPQMVTEARLAVDIFDRKTHEALWHAIVDLDARKLTGEAASQQIDQAVRAALLKLPGTVAPKP